MENFSVMKVFICSLFITSLLSLSSPARSQEVEDEHEFNYDENSEEGPSHWGDIKPEWSLCKTGRMQSPIGLNNKRVQVVNLLGSLILNYNPSNATLKNRGHDISLEFLEETSNLQINGSRYILKQLHWHTPSEHTIDGQRVDLELHLVHQTPSNNQIAVIGILYKIGITPDNLLSLLEEDLKAISNSTSISVGVIDPREVNINKNIYYRFMGSLTTPPCSENVTWTIVKQIGSVTRDQINLLRDAVHDDSNGNARPIQPTNNRTVQLNIPKYIFN